MHNEITWLGAFLAGFISFLSPCVLPLVPGYLSFLAGVSLEELRTQSDQTTRRVLWAAVFFVLGFSAVFILLGATATLAGSWLLAHSRWLGKAAGVLIIVLGLHLTGVIQLPFLLFEKRFHLQGRKMNYAGVFLIGAAFAFGWSPCVGPLLAGILALAGSQKTVATGMVLLAWYSAGLGLPFLLAAAAVERFVYWSRRFSRYLRLVEIFAGILLIGIGLAMFFDSMLRISAWFGAFSRFGL